MIGVDLRRFFEISTLYFIRNLSKKSKAASMENICCCFLLMRKKLVMIGRAIKTVRQLVNEFLTKGYNMVLCCHRFKLCSFWLAFIDIQQYKTIVKPSRLLLISFIIFKTYIFSISTVPDWKFHPFIS